LLIERTEYLKLLQRTSRSLIQVIERILGGAYPRAEAYSTYRPQLEAVAKGQAAILAELDGILDFAVGGEGETDLVSQDELSELLKE
jgi:hypothetical protein